MGDRVTVTMVPLADLIPTTDNPRRLRSTDPAVLELAESIKAHGVLQPVLARPHPHPKKKGKFDLRAGARRHMAAGIAGLTEIPTIVRELDDRAALEITVTENLQREDLTPMEEAKGVQSLLDQDRTYEQVAEQIGRSPSWVARRARLTHLSDQWRALLDNPDNGMSAWPASVLELVARLEAPAQDELLTDNPWLASDDEPVTADLIRGLVDEMLRDMKAAAWKLDDADLIPAAGACSECSKRTSQRQYLFEDMANPKADCCIDAACWHDKAVAFLTKVHAELQEKHGEIAYLHMGYNDAAVPAEFKGNAAAHYEYEGCKKSEKGAVPCLHVNGPGTGKWFWGRKPTRKDTASPDTPPAKDKQTEPGNPTEREEIAQAFAHAHVARVAGWVTAEHDSPDGLPCALYALGERIEHRTPEGRQAREWLKERLGMMEPGIHPNELPTPKEPAALTGDYIGPLCALGLYDVLQEDADADTPVKIGFTYSDADTVATAFEIPAAFLELHKKADILIIAKELGVKIKSSMKAGDARQAILDAKLPPGSLTKNLAKAFGVSYNEPKADADAS